MGMGVPTPNATRVYCCTTYAEEFLGNQNERVEPFSLSVCPIQCGRRINAPAMLITVPRCVYGSMCFVICCLMLSAPCSMFLIPMISAPSSMFVCSLSQTLTQIHANSS